MGWGGSQQPPPNHVNLEAKSRALLEDALLLESGFLGVTYFGVCWGIMGQHTIASSMT